MSVTNNIGKCYFMDGSVEDIDFIWHYSDTYIDFGTASGRYSYRKYGLESDELLAISDRYRIHIMCSQHTFEQHYYDALVGERVYPAYIDHIEISNEYIEWHDKCKGETK